MFTLNWTHPREHCCRSKKAFSANSKPFFASRPLFFIGKRCLFVRPSEKQDLVVYTALYPLVCTTCERSLQNVWSFSHFRETLLGNNVSTFALGLSVRCIIILHCTMRAHTPLDRAWLERKPTKWKNRKYVFWSPHKTCVAFLNAYSISILAYHYVWCFSTKSCHWCTDVI